MHIGLDFDNTIACYDQSFIKAATGRNLLPPNWSGGKRALRDFLRNKGDVGEQEWQALQGRVYGKLMPEAELKPGVGWFLLFCKARKIPVSIVSHKTEYSPKDPARIPLRSAALQWMTAKGFFGSNVYGLKEDKIFFESTRRQKVERIKSLGCTHFVDDLLEVFQEENFPRDVEKLLYDPEGLDQQSTGSIDVHNSWSSIGNSLLGAETHAELGVIVRGVVPKETIQECVPISPGGNSTVFKLCLSDKSENLLKRYPQEIAVNRSRLKTEVSACRLLRTVGIEQPAEVIYEDVENEIAVFRWIDGSRVANPKAKHIESLLQFVEELRNIKRTDEVHAFPSAKEACLNGQDICDQIQNRRDRLGRREIKSEELKTFLSQIFDPLVAKTIAWAQEEWPAGRSFFEPLPRKFQTLSPSDFGFHNALWERSGKLRVVDLEYFGWDDPVKLASDFCWHPAMKIPQRLQQKWILGMRQLFSSDQDFENRLTIAHPLYGLRWAMIVLKPFFSKGGRMAGRDQLLQDRLCKSRSFCDDVRNWVDRGHQQF